MAKVTREHVKKAVVMIGEGMTEGDVAYRLGVTLWGLKTALFDAGHVHRSKQASKVDDARLLKLVRSGLTYKRIAAEFGVSERTIEGRLQRLRVQRRAKEVRSGALKFKPLLPGQEATVVARSVPGEAFSFQPGDTLRVIEQAGSAVALWKPGSSDYQWVDRKNVRTLTESADA